MTAGAARPPAVAVADSAREAVDAYHDVLTEDVAADSHAVLDAQTRKRDLFFGDRPLCTVLRPRFMTPAQYRLLQRRAGALMGAFGRAYAAAVADPAVRSQLRLTPWEEEFVLDDPGFPWPSPVSRLDAFFAGDNGLRFTEYNAETPAGPLFNDVLTELFFALPAMRQFYARVGRAAAARAAQRPACAARAPTRRGPGPARCHGSRSSIGSTCRHAGSSRSFRNTRSGRAFHVSSSIPATPSSMAAG